MPAFPLTGQPGNYPANPKRERVLTKIVFVNTRWTHISLDDGHGKIIKEPDLADIIYHIFRCSHAHAEEVPLTFTVLPSQQRILRWMIGIEDKSVHMPDTVIFALLAVSVFSKVNVDIVSAGDLSLTWGNQTGYFIFPVKESWGREDEVKLLLAGKNMTRVKLNGL